MTEENGEAWYLYKLKKVFGGDLETFEILHKEIGLRYVKVCNMLTDGKLKIEWLEEFSEDTNIQYKDFPANLADFIDELQSDREEKSGEVIAVDGRVAKFIKTEAYEEYESLFDQKYETLKGMYGIIDDEVIKDNDFYKINLLDFENHPFEPNDYVLYKDNQGDMQLGYLHFNKVKNKEPNGIEEFISEINVFIEKAKVFSPDLIKIETDLEMLSGTDWMMIQNYTLINGVLLVKFEVVPNGNLICKSLIKFKDFWPLLIEEKFGTEKYRILKNQCPLIEFNLVPSIVEPYCFSNEMASEIVDKVYGQIPKLENLYPVFVAYDKSRIINGGIERFEKQMADIMLMLDKTDLYNTQSGTRIRKGKINSKMIFLSSILLDDILKTSSDIWSEQEVLVFKMYKEAKKFVSEKHLSDLDVLFFRLHCRNADERELLTNYLVHESVYTDVLKNVKGGLKV